MEVKIINQTQNKMTLASAFNDIKEWWNALKQNLAKWIFLFSLPSGMTSGELLEFS